jgi:hypothetical protein
VTFRTSAHNGCAFPTSSCIVAEAERGETGHVGPVTPRHDVLSELEPPRRAAYQGMRELRHGLRWPAEHPPFTAAVPVDD